MHHWEETSAAGLPGHLLVKQNGRWGIWSEEKGLIQPCQWFRIRPYRDGLAMVESLHPYCEGTLWGLVDENGQIVTPCRWRYDPSVMEYGQKADGRFVNGYAVIAEECRRHHTRFGYIDRGGSIISPCIWDYAGSFDGDGHPALVFRQDGNYRDAPGEWCGQHDWFFYYEEIPDYKIHPNDEGQYCPRGFFYLLPNGDVLTPGGIRHLSGKDPDGDLGRGWLEAEPFCNGIARVMYEDTWETISLPPAAL